jgi:hypothetical protein
MRSAPERDHDEAGLAVFTEKRPDDPKSQHLDEARRYAKLVATDVRLYNEEAVILGRQHGDLADRLWVHLQRGREAFLRRFPDLGSEEGLALLHDAYVQVLAGGDSALLRLGKDLSRLP